MSDLYPTPTRLALLREVSNGAVYGRRGTRNETWNVWCGVTRRVTAAVREMERAGWVRVGPADSPSWYSRKTYLLTDAGRAVLDAGGHR